MKLSTSLEDYLETIFLLSKKSIVRSKNIAKALCVKQPSVTKALNHLAKRGLIDYSPYGPIQLTEKGLSLAKKVLEKHLICKKFFENVLHLEEEEAELHACSLEHILSKKAFIRMKTLVDYFENNRPLNFYE
jgi:DtxR family transcriptional regulator, Mn-dependent transcriptional regulator